MLSFTTSLYYHEQTNAGPKPRTLNIGLWSFYRKDFTPCERILFEKMITLQSCFGTGKQFGYALSRLQDETGFGKDAVRSALDKLEKRGFLSIKRFSYQGKETHKYLVHYDVIAASVDQIWDKDKMNDKHDLYHFTQTLPAYYRLIGKHGRNLSMMYLGKKVGAFDQDDLFALNDM